MKARRDAGRGDGVESADAYMADEVSPRNVGRGGETGSEAGPSDVADKPRWHVEGYMKRYPDILDCHLKLKAVSRSNPFT